LGSYYGNPSDASELCGITLLFINAMELTIVKQLPTEESGIFFMIKIS